MLRYVSNLASINETDLKIMFFKADFDLFAMSQNTLKQSTHFKTIYVNHLICGERKVNSVSKRVFLPKFIKLLLYYLNSLLLGKFLK